MRNSLTRLFARLVVPIAGISITLGLSPLAFAHDSVVGGSPANGETVQEIPRQLSLEFSGIPREGFNTFALSNAQTQEVLFTAEPRLSGRTLTVDVPDNITSEPGEYRIGFQITSSDGHATRGMTTFTVAGNQTGQAAATSSSSQEKDALPAAAIWGIAAIAVLAVIAMVLVIIRRGRITKELRDHGEHRENDERERE